MAVLPRKDTRLKEAALSLSIAQFCFVFVFMQVLGLADAHALYYELVTPGFGIVWALLLDVLLLAVVLFGAFSLRRSKRKSLRLLGSGTVVSFVLFAAYQVVRSLGEHFAGQPHEKLLLSLGGVAGVCLVLFVLLSPRRALRSAELVLLVMTPFYPIAALNALAEYHKIHARPLGQGSAAGLLSGNTHRTRTIWIIFDELDEHLLFESRPQRVHLDQFDALRDQAVFATQVSSPNTDTMPSLPSLILGQRVDAFEEQASNLRVQLQGCSQWQNFDTYPNVFSRARAAGFDTGLSGWYHSYCRLIANDLSECAWAMGNLPFLVAEAALESRSFFQKAVYLIEWQAESFPFNKRLIIGPEPGGVAAFRQDTIDTFNRVMSGGEQMLRDPRVNLVMMHLPIPHPPGIWDSRRESFTTGKSNYVDNLQLANEALRQLRHVLEASGDWDRSLVLVSSDHPYRVHMYESIYFLRSNEMLQLTHMRQGRFVPFLVKFPQQHSEVTYTKKFNSVLTSQLVLAVLQRQISNVDEGVAWLDAHAGDSSADPPCKQ